jgi:PhzF family phenazine biosynthesis protein
MTSIPFFQVDAFAPAPLTGNPAAVMPLEHWLDDATLQAIAAENNLSETAFTVPSERNDADFDLRWFTPASEVELCGHATIATGHILVTGQPLRFSTRSGILLVARRGDLLELDLPAAKLSEGREPALCAALGLADRPVWFAEGCNDAAIVEVNDEAAVRAIEPDMAALTQIARMAVVSACGSTEAIASRVFVPYLGIDEDPVTGSAHAALVPYWAPKLGRTDFTALQASKRTGILDCRLEGDRVFLGGQCRTVIVGQFQL